ncbi:TPR domain protein [Archangium gephyra]|uniref:TPR domain protein n=1 Tax=Archangium gephyra TaxID=48 RepID=A0AAC8QGP9_9BACT|nr:TPR domain protein [Archangium gephyra]
MIPFGARAANEGEIQNYIISISRLYESLDYELALNRVQLARQVPRGTEEEITLSLYEGIILCEMGKQGPGSASFRAALLLRPDAKLPVQVAPKVETLFESVRKQVKDELAPLVEQRETKSSSNEAPSAPSPTKMAVKEELPSTPPARVAVASTPKTSGMPGQMRVGVGGDLFFESSRMTGTWSINNSRTDESFDYTSLGFLSATAWLTTSTPMLNERLRVGAGLRIFGNYTAGGGNQFGFGLLNEAFAIGEYALPLNNKTEFLCGGRVGLSLLVPNSEFETEIRQLQEQGVNVWSVPRMGWLLGLSGGARRQMSDRIWLRADVLVQLEQQYLFDTSQEISGFRFTKNWSTLAVRLGLTLGAEFAL